MKLISKEMKDREYKVKYTRGSRNRRIGEETQDLWKH